MERYTVNTIPFPSDEARYITFDFHPPATAAVLDAVLAATDAQPRPVMTAAS